MAGRGRGQPAHIGGSGQPPAPGTRPGSGGFGQQPPLLPPQQSIPISVVLIEQKLATQHAEIQKLLTENQRLAATHVALRQELSVAHQEAQRLQQLKSSMQAESEGKFLALLEKTANLEAELNALEPLNAELQKVRDDAQELSAHKQELLAQVEQLTDELQKNGSDAHKTSALQLENENLRQELHRARAVYEYEKKASLHQDEQRQAMEKTLILLAKEVEKLHAELTSVKKAKTSGTQGGAYGTGLQAVEAGHSFPHSIQRDDYERHKAVAVDNGVHYGSDLLSYTPNSADFPQASHEGALNINGRNIKAGEVTSLDELKHQQVQDSVYGSLAPALQNSSFSRSEQKPTEIWNTHIAPNGKAFYHNPLTGITQWDRPATLEASESQETAQTHSNQLSQEQAQAAAMQMQQPAVEMSQLRQLQMQQYGELSGQQAAKVLQVPEQQAAHSQVHSLFQSQYMQPTRPQFQDSQVGQGQMNLAAQMSQLIQGQLAYPARGQQQTSYQISQSDRLVQAQAEHHLQSRMPSHLS
ncbi:hypothetical protein O6H91_01G104300 [Diphasiastrum complanatum]|uniref:Uncharacterized protein n=1 Tax=Diphasiastrum complanatum TaxID=34168 RepID=A0ACC2EUD6_DIPCM|nr:hypothetical protein O6H91_01G104300 [Diphasiastrum complanatum]